MNETQELALKRVFDRVPLVATETPSRTIMPMPVYGVGNLQLQLTLMTFDAGIRFNYLVSLLV